MHRHEEVADAVRQIVAERQGVDVAAVTAESVLADDLGVDSLGMIEIGVSLEERFGLRMPDAATPDELGIVTVDDLVGLALERLQEAAR